MPCLTILQVGKSILEYQLIFETMRKIYSLILAFLATVSDVQAQQHEILDDRIATLQVVAGNDWLSPPVIVLGSDTPINISFDDLTHEYHRYAYRIEHCEADWSPSDEIFPSDYCDGFTEGNAIDDITESINTNVLYTHYSFQLPNSRCRMKIGGNYKVTIYDENNDKDVVTACFMVVEPEMSVAASVTTNTDIDVNRAHQQVSMSLNYGGIKITNPQTEIKTVVMQNGRWDNAAVNPSPQYITPDGLGWKHNRQLIFKGGNEYRKFEVLDVSHTTMGLESISWDGKNYNAFVWTDEPRPSYVYDEDANGSFYIRNSNNIENDYSSEYVYVHFRLKTPMSYGDIYLNGIWTNDRPLPQYKMVFNAQTRCYEKAVLLKQGYYSYQYLLLCSDGSLSPLPSEGNFCYTENKYQCLVYYRGLGQRTDRLFGYVQIKAN